MPSGFLLGAGRQQIRQDPGRRVGALANREVVQVRVVEHQHVVRAEDRLGERLRLVATRDVALGETVLDDPEQRRVQTLPLLGALGRIAADQVDQLHQEVAVVRPRLLDVGRVSDATMLGLVCVNVLSDRADPELAELMADTELMYAALQMGDTEAGRAVLRQMSTNASTEPRAYALLGLALSDEAAASELVALSADFAVSDRIDIAQELFERQRPEAAIEIIVDTVTSGTNRTVREHAFRALLHDEAGEAALRGLARSGDDAVATHAAHILLNRGSLADSDADLLDDAIANGNVSILNNVQRMTPQVQRRVIAYIDDPSTRSAAMRALARTMPTTEALRLAGNDPDLQGIVMNHSQDADDSMVQVGRRLIDEHGLAYFANRYHGHPVAQQLMREALSSSDASERRIAVGHVGASSSTETLEVLARDRDDMVRGQAMRHLLDRQGGASLRAGLAGVRDSDPEIRELAVQSLAHTPDPNARQAVIDALHDPEPAVAQQAALSVLNTIGGEAFDEVVALALSSHAHRGALAHMVLESDYTLDESTRASLQTVADSAPWYSRVRGSRGGQY